MRGGGLGFDERVFFITDLNILFLQHGFSGWIGDCMRSSMFMNMDGWIYECGWVEMDGWIGMGGKNGWKEMTNIGTDGWMDGTKTDGLVGRWVGRQGINGWMDYDWMGYLKKKKKDNEKKRYI